MTNQDQERRSFSPEKKQAILDLARQAQPAEAMFSEALKTFERSHGSLADWTAFREACLDINAILEPLVRQLVDYTPNNFDTYRMTMGPNPDLPTLHHGVWFRTDCPAQYLECVAQYGSFNENFWRSQGWSGFDPTKYSHAAQPADSPAP